MHEEDTLFGDLTAEARSTRAIQLANDLICFMKTRILMMFCETLSCAFHFKIIFVSLNHRVRKKDTFNLGKMHL
uniref:Uncharacterized protein n=1 Tax=Aegilops tauschii subsp. strangulata TaxID=200361 RepID=A0A453MPH7_AEGTS